jgi:hypothetical protein
MMHRNIMQITPLCHCETKYYLGDRHQSFISCVKKIDSITIKVKKGGHFLLFEKLN